MKPGAAINLIVRILLGIWSVFILFALIFSPPEAEGKVNIGSSILIAILFVALPWGILSVIHVAIKRKKAPDDQSTPHPPPTDTSATETSVSGMTASSYAEFRQLAKMALNDNIIEADEAQLLAKYLHQYNGADDSRTRHLSVTLDAILNAGTFSEADAEELRVLLGEFIDIDAELAHSTSQKQKTEQDRQTPSKAAQKAQRKEAKRRVARTQSFGKIRVGMTCDITYIDGNGNISDRRVHVLAISTNKSGNEIIRCRCKKANATRSFRRDRILAAINIDTGELLD